jgi:imidazolonepropionase-like amidohydrolase
MKHFIIIQALLLAFSGSLFSQAPTPGKASNKKILIRYATAHLGNGEKLENAYVAVQGKELLFVSDANKARINPSEFDSIIDASGKHLYPGFIVMDSRLGLTEIDAVKATRDFSETGTYNPNVRALPAFNTESKIIATMRPNGVLMSQVAPKGGVISGASSAVHFDGWNWKDAAIKADEGIYLNWPQRYRYTGWWVEPGPGKENKKYDDQINEIADYFAEAKAYSGLENVANQNLRFESMNGLFEGSKRLYVRVSWAKDILDVIQFLRASGVKNYAIVGGEEAHLVTTDLKENKVPVVINRVHQLPEHDDDALNAPYELAAKLVAEGIEVSFAMNGDMEAMTTRNLPFQAGTAVHYGLDYEQAIKAITLNPAKLMGIDKKYGSLESGKIATFFLAEGDILDMRTNQIIIAFVEGRIIDLSNSQTALYEKFLQKIKEPSK